MNQEDYAVMIPRGVYSGLDHAFILLLRHEYKIEVRREDLPGVLGLYVSSRCSGIDNGLVVSRDTIWVEMVYVYLLALAYHVLGHIASPLPIFIFPRRSAEGVLQPRLASSDEERRAMADDLLFHTLMGGADIPWKDERYHICHQQLSAELKVVFKRAVVAYPPQLDEEAVGRLVALWERAVMWACGFADEQLLVNYDGNRPNSGPAGVCPKPVKGRVMGRSRAGGRISQQR
jgi:hypothetical protein